jgi:hypothetical protein
MTDALDWVLDLAGRGAGAILGLVLTAGVVSAVVTKLFDKGAKRDEHARQGYASATAALVAWGEFPYRVARRTSDAPEVLAALAGHGHDTQEALACRRAWVVGESRILAEVFAATASRLKPQVAAATQEAWRRAPMQGAAGMVLSDGAALPSIALDDAVDAWCLAITYRFGWRRWAFWFPGLLRWRLRKQGLLPERTSVGAVPPGGVELAA